MNERPPSAVPVERVRGERPVAEDWRADGVAQSRHSRLLDHLVEPLDDHDPDRAEEVCAQICRAALVDLAPALLLVPVAERRRARVLGAFSLILFDFAAQSGLDGDRLAELNRWEFRLEEALDGRPAGQPIFVLLAREEALRPWRREALDEILGAARRRAVAGARTGPATATTRDDDKLARGLIGALLGEAPPDEVVKLARTLLGAGNKQPPGRGAKAVRELPRRWRPAARYLTLAHRRRTGSGAESDSHLGLGARLGLLLRARLGI